MTAAVMAAGGAIAVGSLAFMVFALVKLESAAWLVTSVVGVGIGLTLLALAAWRQDAADERDCLASGGAWVVDHYSTTYVMSGKVLVPIRSAVHACVGVPS